MAELQSHVPDPSQRHEQRDVNVPIVALFGLGVVVLLLGSLALMGWLFGIFDTSRPGSEVTPAALLADRPLPPSPRLQASPAQELQELRAQAEAVLQSYGWVDRAAGIVRIPIHRAIELLAEQGLPIWQAGQDDGKAAPGAQSGKERAGQSAEQESPREQGGRERDR